MKKLFLSSLIAFSFILPVLANEFSDVGELHPDFVAITQLSDEGVLNGYDDGTFRPEQMVNRAEAVKIILAGLKVEPETSITGSVFPDVLPGDWFAGYVAAAKLKGLVNGNADGNFTPSRMVSRAELAKMLLIGVGFKNEGWDEQQMFDDVPLHQWYSPYMNYAGKSGIISRDKDNRLFPARMMKRAEVAETIYLLQIMLRGEDVAFLVVQAEKQMLQIEPYLTISDLQNARRAAALAVNMMEQAIRINFDDQLILAKAKIAKSYLLLVDALISMVKKNKVEAADFAQQAMVKAEEAARVHLDVQTKSDYLVKQAKSLIEQASN